MDNYSSLNAVEIEQLALGEPGSSIMRVPEAIDDSYPLRLIRRFFSGVRPLRLPKDEHYCLDLSSVISLPPSREDIAHPNTDGSASIGGELAVTCRGFVFGEVDRNLFP